MSEKRVASSGSIYLLAEDKQRIVIIGKEATTITLMITHTLTACNRKFDCIVNGEIDDSQSIKRSSAAVLILLETRKPSDELLGYRHHMGVISEIENTQPVTSAVTAFADATPKAGVLIYQQAGAAGDIGKKPRTDVTSIPYGIYAYKEEQGKLLLITSTNERFPIRISGTNNLTSLSAAKEVLKKIGITSGQFYKAMTTLELPAPH